MGFIDERKEYVIENMFPKRPWMNYLWNEEYIVIMNQFGMGKGRISAEHNYQRDIVRDCDSRLVYIKTEDEIYAVNRNYNRLAFEEFKTVVGMGYSTIISEYKKLRSELTIFVPHKGKRECWQLKLMNCSDERKTFDLYAMADLDSQLTEHLSVNVGDFDKTLNGVCFSHCIYDSPTKYHYVHFASDGEVHAYETAKRRFVGVYGDLRNPDGIKQKALDSQGNAFDAGTVAVLQFKVELAPGEEKKILFTAGVEASLEKAADNSKEVLTTEYFDKELLLLKQQADKYDGCILVNTPDEEVNRFANIWLKRQMELGKTWGRVYNKGFRDIMQDISGFVQLDSQVCRDKIVDCTQYQKIDGNTLRSWVPLHLHPYMDGATWLISTVVAYMKETADKSILNEKIGYYDSDVKENLLEHCIRGLDFLYREVGAHGLCLWGGGDWNDSFDGACLNMIGESVWLSIATVKCTKEFIELCNWLGLEKLAKEYYEKSCFMEENIHKHGWDKDHYIYGINDWGERVGSYDTPTGQIFLNPQTWAVLAKIAKDEQVLMDLVERELSCDFGYVQQKPCYDTPNPHVGRISCFGKGFYENGSVYNHGVAFKLVADCLIGRGNEAYDTLKRLLPSNPKNDYAKSGVEPYALCNMFFGPENELRPGEAPMYWITGTSSWTFRAIVEYMIGVQADFSGLRIRPTLPDVWDNVTIRRAFRGTIYDITIERTGSNEMYVDGIRSEDKIVPVFGDGKVHKVFVTCK